MQETKLRVRYAETDQMGVVYYANYYIWMEVGRSELVRALGLCYETLEREEGLLLSVVESQCRYLAPARYDQEILIGTTIAGANTRMVEFEYSIRNAATSQVLARGATKHMWLDRSFKPTKVPALYLEILKASIVEK